jgi:hypothetical protein
MIWLVNFICRSAAEIITLSAARQLVRCHGNERIEKNYISKPDAFISFYPE